jgi:transposase-like protein
LTQYIPFVHGTLLVRKIRYYLKIKRRMALRMLRRFPRALWSGVSIALRTVRRTGALPEAL